ncbi:MAG: hypothetical protein JWM59_3404 [Verrucomicrobiales bacterium]|nr:hypothetical protein [Verrucomicrobiales bacterium]
MDKTSADRLLILAVIWNGLSGGHANSFQQEFASDLEYLKNLQASGLDRHCAAGRLFEMKVIRACRQRFPRSKILQFKASLNRCN